MSLNLRTLGGRLLITVIQSSSAVAQRVLATSCECCRYCCRAIGLPDECGNYQQSCRSCPDGLRRSCDEPCPERPPCLLQCVEIGQTPCGDPVYDCPVYSTESIGIVVESCDECPPPPPCKQDYYCCYQSAPSQNPASPLPPRNCQIGPCSSPTLYSSGPHQSLVQCQAVCQNWYCCYEFAPSQNPESPLPPRFCQPVPCKSPELHASGPHPTLAACQKACENWYCCYDEQPSKNPDVPLPHSTCQLGPCAEISLQKSGPHYTLDTCRKTCNACTKCSDCIVGEYCCNNVCLPLCEAREKPCFNCADVGFPAFDGSGRCFRRYGVYDFDCCPLNPGQSAQNNWPDDGYIVFEKRCGQCVVVDSARWYAANGYAVGAKVGCPPIINGFNVQCLNPPGAFNTPTKCSVIRDAGCCNPTGAKIWIELFDEILPCNPLP